jgi:hypothetical protein
VENFTPKQLEALDLLKAVYPRGVGIEDQESRAVFDSLMVRKPSMVEQLDYDDSPSGDCYRLTDDAAEAFRGVSEELAQSAAGN